MPSKRHFARGGRVGPPPAALPPFLHIFALPTTTFGPLPCDVCESLRQLITAISNESRRDHFLAMRTCRRALGSSSSSTPHYTLTSFRSRRRSPPQFRPICTARSPVTFDSAPGKNRGFPCCRPDKSFQIAKSHFDIPSDVTRPADRRRIALLQRLSDRLGVFDNGRCLTGPHHWPVPSRDPFSLAINSPRGFSPTHFILRLLRPSRPSPAPSLSFAPFTCRDLYEELGNGISISTGYARENAPRPSLNHAAGVIGGPRLMDHLFLSFRAPFRSNGFRNRHSIISTITPPTAAAVIILVTGVLSADRMISPGSVRFVTNPNFRRPTDA
uniref:Uncharacterized protein n=1 Tax=Steinernema glaseri TaxID=37863 RepID=A0A1I8AFP2_9BILA